MHSKILKLIVLLLTIAYNAEAAGSISGTVTSRGEGVVDAVVYIDSINGNFLPPKKNPVMDQKNLTFIPHVMPILIGTTVDFINSDDVLNNVFTPSWAGRRFNLGTYPKGIVRSFTFNRVGEVIILCNIHPEMEAYILVLKNPFFAITDKEGKFSIAEVPPGKYTLRAWHEDLKSQAKIVSVPEGAEVTVRFDLIR